jgi:histidinol dehydrogenase
MRVEPLSSIDKRLVEISQRLTDKDFEAKERAVREIVSEVKNKGDKALAQYSKKFDKFDFDLNQKQPFAIKLGTHLGKINLELRQALEKAKDRIELYHRKEHENLIKNWTMQGSLGEELGARYLPLESVAVYVPACQASLMSTVLMTAVPAKVAGVKRIVMISPPPINDAILAAAELAGVGEVYALGGAQAIAALAYGTESIKPVDKIVGPGNVYVSLAKKMVYGQVGIDGIYGPSELAVIADGTASPAQIAADLLSQLEHGSGLESTLLVTTSKQVAEQTRKELDKQIQELAVYKSEAQIQTIKNSWSKWSDIFEVADLEEAARIINRYAPEHLELQVKNADLESLVAAIKNAGAIFIGSASCESLGDYLAGPSHSLPTGATARFSSGLHSYDFVKKISMIDFSKVVTKGQAFTDLIRDVAIIARAEMLEGHARAMELRHAN